jgi:hypothetical protein
VNINLSAIGTQATANLGVNAAGQPRDGDGDNGVEPPTANAASAARPQLPSNSTVSFYA